MPENYAKILHLELAAAEMEISANARQKLERYCEDLERWNDRINLTSLSGSSLVKRLVIEPVFIGQKLEMGGTLLDIGSGNGSPAVPLCLTRPFHRAHWVDARIRRAAFLRHLVASLELTGVEVHRSRFEDLIDIGSPDWITFQAVFPTAALLAAARRVGKLTTKLIWMTSRSAEKVSGANVVEIPFSNTEVRILNLADPRLDPS